MLSKRLINCYDILHNKTRVVHVDVFLIKHMQSPHDDSTVC